MKSKFRLYLSALSAWLIPACFGMPALAQDGSHEDEIGRKPAVLVFVNACETPLAQRWKASLDFWVGGKLVAGDIRIGERSPAISLSRADSGNIGVFKQGATDPFATPQIPFVPNHYYVVIVTGKLSDAATGPHIHVLSEPDTLAAEIGGKSRVTVFNAVDSFALQFAMGKSKPKTIVPFAETILLESPGEYELALNFPYKKGEVRTMRSSIMTTAGDNYFLILRVSGERSDRPAITRLSGTSDRRDIADIQLSDEQIPADEAPAIPSGSPMPKPE